MQLTVYSSRVKVQKHFLQNYYANKMGLGTLWWRRKDGVLITLKEKATQYMDEK